MARYVLLIDDDGDFRKLLEMRLKSFLKDAAFFTASSLKEAREILATMKENSFELVCLDQHLGDGKGEDLLREGVLRDMAVLSLSSDDAPEIPGATIGAGATFFLKKRDSSTNLFRPLVEGIIERSKLQRELARIKVNAAVMDGVKTLINTLRHEINNPLGAVLGAAYLLKNAKEVSADQREAASLVEASGQRIRHVLDELCKAMSLEATEKASHKVFHIPGDKPWGKDDK
jgi:signal transduction histidine kinase